MHAHVHNPFCSNNTFTKPTPLERERKSDPSANHREPPRPPSNHPIFSSSHKICHTSTTASSPHNIVVRDSHIYSSSIPRLTVIIFPKVLRPRAPFTRCRVLMTFNSPPCIASFASRSPPSTPPWATKERLRHSHPSHRWDSSRAPPLAKPSAMSRRSLLNPFHLTCYPNWVNELESEKKIGVMLGLGPTKSLTSPPLHSCITILVYYNHFYFYTYFTFLKKNKTK